MTSLGAAVLVAALVLTAAVAWWLRTRSGAVRAPAPAPVAARAAVAEPTGPQPQDVLVELGVRPADAELTVVQFSTAFCGPCRATRARLQQLQTSRPGLAYVDIDADEHLDAVRQLDIRRTPTLFYLGRDGRLIGRSSGAPRPEELTALVNAYAGMAS